MERRPCGLLLSQFTLRRLFCIDWKLAAHHNGQVSMLLRFIAGVDMTADTLGEMPEYACTEDREVGGGMTLRGARMATSWEGRWLGCSKRRVG